MNLFQYGVSHEGADDRDRRGAVGSALTLACSFFNVAFEPYVVKVSHFQKPDRRSIMKNFCAMVFRSPRNNSHYGRNILAEDPDSPG